MSRFLKKLDYKKPSIEFNPFEENDVVMTSTTEDGGDFGTKSDPEWWS